MEIVLKALLATHVVAGFSSLVLFWIPALARKGGRLHNTVGRWYVRCMWVVLITAILLSIKNLYVGQLTTAAFLGFLAVLTAKPLWFGVAILRHKRDFPTSARRRLLQLNGLLVATGLLLLAYGLWVGLGAGGVLFVIFGALGLSNIVPLRQLWHQTFWVRPWIIEHLSGMIVSGIAAHTAFFAFGGQQLFADWLSGYWMVIPWVAPTIIGTSIIKIMERKYLRTSSTTVDVEEADFS